MSPASGQGTVGVASPTDEKAGPIDVLGGAGSSSAQKLSTQQRQQDF